MWTDRLTLRDSALLALRLSVAFVFLWHGVPKAFDPALGFEKFVGFGLPGFLGPVIGALETVAGILLAVGILHLWASLLLAVVIVGAIVTVQIPGGISAGLERDLLILAATLVLAAQGPGRLSVAGALPDPGSTRSTGTEGARAS